MKQRWYIGDGVFNHKTSANHGYVFEVSDKKEKMELKKKGYIIFKNRKHAENYRLADILGG